MENCGNSALAPPWACLFMSHLEQKILSSWGGTQPLLFKRFIDDIFFIWPGSEEELKEFIAHMNSAHTHIKFTSTYDVETKSIPFLDTWVTLKEGNFITIEGQMTVLRKVLRNRLLLNNQKGFRS